MSTMTGTYDFICKQLIDTCPEQFVAWVDTNARFVQERNVEFSIKHRYTDALLEVTLNGRHALLHFEFQVAFDKTMQDRMLGYGVMASEEYDLPVSSHLIYLRPHRNLPVSPYIKRFVDGSEVLRFHYHVIKFWEMPAELILANDWEGLLPLLPLAKDGKKPSLIQAMVEKLATNENKELLALAQMVGGLVFTQSDELEQFERSFAMLKDILKESRTAQKIHNEGHAEGRAEEHEKALAITRATATREIQTRFPESLSMIQPLIEQLTDLAILNQLLIKIGAVQTGAELLHFLQQSPLLSLATSSHLD